MRANRKRNNIIIGGLCVILLIMTVGYATFYSQLKITGTSAVTSNWDIEVTNIRSNNLGSTAYDIKTPTYTSNSATFSAGFKVPNDMMLYEVEVSNLGSIDGQISVTDLDCGGNAAILCYTSQTSDKMFDDNWEYIGSESNFEFGFSEGSSDLINEFFSIKQGEKKYLYIDVEFDDVSSMPDNLTSNIKLNLNYVQYNNEVELEPIMMAMDDSKAFWQSTYKSKISTVDVLTNKDVPTDAVESWDVSKWGNGAVMAWIEDDSENSGMYKLYIGGDGGVYAPSDSEELFYNFSKTTSMNLANLDTSKVTNMSSMFSGCSSLTSLDLSNLDTSKVTNMSSMFSGCSKLTSLDLRNFDTGQVTTMSYMFYNCSSLTTLDVSNFDTSKVTTMSSMFYYCRKLTKLNLCSFDTSKVTKMDQMFRYTPKLTAINVSSKWTTASATTTNMFTSSGVSAVTVLDNCAYDTEEIKLSLATSATSNTITVVANASAISGIAKYEYSNDNGSTWISSTDNTYTFNDLLQEKNYNIKVRITSNSSKQTIISKTVSTSAITVPTYSEQNYTFPRSITITYPEGCGSTYTCSYQKNNDSLVAVTSTTVTVTFDEEGSLVGNISDGINSASSSYTVIPPVDMNGVTVPVVTTGDGLYSDSTETGRYVYKGDNPNNYIKLGSDLYRIISFESDGTLKVIKNGSIGDMPFDPGYSTSISGVTDASSVTGTRYSNTSTDYCYKSSGTASSYYGCNVWGSKTTMLDSSGTNVTTMPREVGGDSYNLPDTEAYLNTYLNSTWLNTLSTDIQNKITTHMFNVGVTKDDETSLSNIMAQEQAYKWKGKVGLISASDYVKASSNTFCTVISDSSNIVYNGGTCNNWIKNTWTISPYSSSFAGYEFIVYSGGYFSYAIADNSNGVVPVLYLSSNITLTGEGTSSNPYVLSA